MTVEPNSVLVEALEKALPQKLHYPGSDSYNVSQSSFFVSQQSQLSPACIFKPTSSEDVATFLKLYIASVDKAPNLKLAIRGGGHSTLVGSSNIDDGVTLDMRSLNSIHVQEGKELVSVGAGAVWGELYSVLDPLNLSVVGGHGYDVGVAGFTLGGGISPFSPRHGFACDMVENFEVVLADGKIVQANKEVNHDLWIALKGGLNNLGIVTRFDLKVFPQSKIWGGYVVTPASALDENLAALAKFVESWNPLAAVEQSYSFSADRGLSIVNNMEFTDGVENPPELQDFTAIKPIYRNTMRLSSLTEIAKENQQLQAVGVRQTFCTTSFYFDLEHLKAVFDSFQAALPSVKEIEGMRWTLTYRVLHGDMTTKGTSAGGNSTGLGSPEKILVVCVLTSSWKSSTGDLQMRSSCQKFIEEVDARSKESGLFYPFKYVNYAAAFQDPLAGAAEGTKERLQDASKKYDGDGVFQKLVPGGFKLN